MRGFTTDRSANCQRPPSKMCIRRSTDCGRRSRKGSMPPASSPMTPLMRWSRNSGPSRGMAKGRCCGSDCSMATGSWGRTNLERWSAMPTAPGRAARRRGPAGRAARHRDILQREEQRLPIDVRDRDVEVVRQAVVDVAVYDQVLDLAFEALLQPVAQNREPRRLRDPLLAHLLAPIDKEIPRPAPRPEQEPEPTTDPPPQSVDPALRALRTLAALRTTGVASSRARLAPG